jgi:hypothetical protein
MLFGSNLLEVAIGMVFVYLLLSLLCSALGELIESFLRFRASDLKKGIGNLLQDPDLANKLFQHPLIKPLGEKPSYIPARTFSLALWSIATQSLGSSNLAVTQDIEAIRGAISKVNGELGKSLLTLIDEAKGDIDKARTNVEQWFDDAMDRVSGWYKRRTHWILLVIGLVAAAILNIDTITVTRSLWYNDTLRRSVTSAAETYVGKSSQGTQTTDASTKDADAQAKAALAKVEDIQGEINKLGLPIGWISRPDDVKALEVYRHDPRSRPEDFVGWFLKLLGLVFTALAVSQGAPFWFDVLNKFMVVRSTIKPREKSQEEPSK